jgi:hypothetical protein
MYKYVLTSRPLLTLIGAPEDYDASKNALPNPLQQLLNPASVKNPTEAQTLFSSTQQQKPKESPAFKTSAASLPKQEQREVDSEALQGMRQLISDVLEPKMEHLRATLMAKLAAQEDQLQKMASVRAGSAPAGGNVAQKK